MILGGWRFSQAISDFLMSNLLNPYLLLTLGRALKSSSTRVELCPCSSFWYGMTRVRQGLRYKIHPLQLVSFGWDFCAVFPIDLFFFFFLGWWIRILEQVLSSTYLQLTGGDSIETKERLCYIYFYFHALEIIFKDYTWMWIPLFRGFFFFFWWQIISWVVC